MLKKYLRDLYDSMPFKMEIFSLVRRVHIPTKKIYRHLHFKGQITVQVDKDSSFRIVHYGYQLENELFWKELQGYEPTSFELWIKLARISRTILDIGANTGVYGLLAKCVNPESHVVCFEPVQRVFDKLQINCRLNGFDIECVNSAVGNRDGDGIFYDTFDDHVYSVTVDKECRGEVGKFSVNTLITRLDTFFENHSISNIDLLKIDVETYEPEVLEGLGRFLENDKPAMLIEILTDDVAQRVDALVKDLGYLIYNINDDSGRVIKLDCIRKSDKWNLLLCTNKIAQNLGLSCF